MKATQGTTYRMLGSRLNDLSLHLEELRRMGASGKRLNRPSDDPSAIRPILTTRKQLSNVDRQLKTMGQSMDRMQATDGHLEHVENILQRVKEIAVNGVNGALSGEDRTVLADELVHLRQELLDAGNAMVDGKYIFAGFQEDTKPFTLNPSYDPASYDVNDHRTWPVLYNGDDNPTMLEIAPAERLQVNLTGNDLFLGSADWNPPPYDPPTSGGNPPNSVDAGRMDLFAVITRTEEALRANDQTAMQDRLTEIDIAADQNRRLRSQLGNRTARVETAMHHQEGTKVDLRQVLSRYEDADAIETFNAIVQQETAFEAALNVTAKVSKLSILDFM